MKRTFTFLLSLSIAGVYAQDTQNTSVFKAYNKYDFVAGDQVIFEDDFREDQDGEFPAHWKLKEGQAVVNTMGDERLLAITKYYTALQPNIKTKNYVPSEYTIELDIWQDKAYDSNEGVFVSFYQGDERISTVRTGNSQVSCDFPGGRLAGNLPADLAGDQWFDKWHHLAISVKENQLKVYVDQYRVLVVPDNGFNATAIGVNGDASENMQMLFKEFRFAKGGGMNMIGKKFTDAKLVTHGIRFDYNKATIKPESMGTLNMIVQILKDNPELKFQVGGHTDSDGEEEYNLKLSNQRAEAVKTRLVAMGIDAARLTATGYGETQPISPNTTPEAKANNRRVEFLKI